MAHSVVMAATGRHVGHFEAQTAEELVRVLWKTLPRNCGCTLFRGLEALEPNSPLQNGETISIIVKQHYEVTLVIKHREQAWSITPPVVTFFAPDVSAHEVVEEYYWTEPMDFDQASDTLLTAFSEFVPESLAVWERGQATYRSAKDTLELVADAMLVLLLAANPGSPPLLFIARSKEDVVAMGVDNVPTTGNHHGSVELNYFVNDVESLLGRWAEVSDMRR
jgi:hypothetical protein